MSVRGVRGAIDASEDRPDEILRATRELLTAILEANPTLRSEDIASAIFTSTDDLKISIPSVGCTRNGLELCPDDLQPGDSSAWRPAVLHQGAAALEH